ncbi:unnamed protein product [Linum trigynum]|uniref:Uncharacterized protein n=1 Tax=Linum trigynum TaxID=586398 RepID=A0AAV2DTL0_9ROSI
MMATGERGRGRPAGRRRERRWSMASLAARTATLVDGESNGEDSVAGRSRGGRRRLLVAAAALPGKVE